MGNTSSSSSSVTIDTSVALSSLTETIQNNMASTLAQQFNNQTFTLDFSGTIIKNSGITVNQDIDSNTNASGQLTSTGLQSANTTLQSDLSAAVDQSAKASAGFLSTANSNSSTSTAIKNSLSAAVTTMFTTNDYSNVVSTVVNTQKMKISFAGAIIDSSKLQFSQKIVSTIIAQNVLNAIVKNANETLAAGTTGVQIKQASQSSSGGLDGLFASIGGLYGFLAALGGGFSSISLCCCCCCIILSVIMAMSSGSGKHPNTSGS